MKKLFTVVLAAAMILQTSVLGFAAENMDVSADLQVKGANDAAYSVATTITKGETVDLKADIAMSEVKAEFERQKAEIYKLVTEKEDQDRLDSAAVKGEFTLVLKYPNTSNFVLPSALTNGSKMDGFDDTAKAAFTEKSRSVETVGSYKQLKLVIEVSDGVTVGNLSDKLADMSFTAAGLSVKKDGNYAVTGSMTGAVTISFNYAGKTFTQDMSFTAKKDGKSDIGVSVAVVNPTAVLTVTVENAAADAKVTVNGEEKTLTDGKAEFTLTEGKYNVKVVSGDKTITTDVVVSGNTEAKITVPAKNVVNTDVSNTTDTTIEKIDNAADMVKDNKDVKKALDEDKKVELNVEVKDVTTENKDKIEESIDKDSTINVVKDDVKYVDVKTVVKIDDVEKADIKEGTVVVAVPVTKLDNTDIKVISVGADGKVTEVKKSTTGAAGTYTEDEDYVYITVPVGDSASYAVVPYTDVKAATFTVTFDPNNNKASWTTVVESGQKVAEPSSPSKYGYIFDGWYLNSINGSLYNFNTPVTSDITLVAKYRKNTNTNNNGTSGGKYIPKSGETTTWKNPFLDVSESDWFYDAVKAANRNELMNGTAANYFDPNADITRGMFVTVLYRMAGSPITGVLDFVDVPSYEYYAAAIAWAHKGGIVMGISDTEFAPDDKITREQMAAILYRYMNYNNLDTSAGDNTNVLSYSDSFAMSEYAVPAMQWAVGAGVMNGNGDGTFAPANNATRAEAAAVFVRTLNVITEMAK